MADDLVTAKRNDSQWQNIDVDLKAPTPLPPRKDSRLATTSLSTTTRGPSSITIDSSTADRMPIQEPLPRCLLFDVFGTCVDWRSTVTAALWDAARHALNSPERSVASRVRMQATDMTYEEWGNIAQEWRDSYIVFTKGMAADPSKAWKTVDQHHHDALREILTDHGLINRADAGLDRTSIPLHLVEDGSLWNEEQINQLTLVWHRLDPWPDTCQGIRELNKQFWTCTLTNGNLTLIRNMVANANMEFTHVFSAETFGAYKPNPKIYLGAAEKLGLRPDECALVAAHLDDLKAAKACGYRTVYVERAREERHPDLLEQKEGIVDLFVGLDEGGFVAVAEKLGVQVDR